MEERVEQDEVLLKNELICVIILTADAVHSITMITEHHQTVLRFTTSITCAAGLLPWSGGRICPTQVTIAKVQNPSVIKTFKLLGHVVGNVPDSRAMLVEDLETNRKVLLLE